MKSSVMPPPLQVWWGDASPASPPCVRACMTDRFLKNPTSLATYHKSDTVQTNSSCSDYKIEDEGGPLQGLITNILLNFKHHFPPSWLKDRLQLFRSKICSLSERSQPIYNPNALQRRNLNSIEIKSIFYHCCGAYYQRFFQFIIETETTDLHVLVLEKKCVHFWKWSRNFGFPIKLQFFLIPHSRKNSPRRDNSRSDEKYRCHIFVLRSNHLTAIYRLKASMQNLIINGKNEIFKLLIPGPGFKRVVSLTSCHTDMKHKTGKKALTNRKKM